MTTIALAQYGLSRVFALGWNTARRLPAGADGDLKEIGQINPYKSEPERGRWRDGFVAGCSD